jgi:hypothetical protein
MEQQNNQTNPTNKLILHSSKVNTFLFCRKAYQWEYEERLVPKAPSFPLQVGDIVHKLFHKHHIGKLAIEDLSKLDEFVQSLYQDNPEEFSAEVALEAGRLVVGYLEKYQDDPLRIIASEIPLEVDMGIYKIVTKIDAICEKLSDNSIWRLEHKTTKQMDSLYLSGLKGGLQGGMYEYAISKVFDERIQGTIYNIIVKTKVPKFDRSYSRTNLAHQKRVLETLNGVANDILSRNLYPSSNCHNYNKACPYLALCDYDCPETREAFYKHKDPLYTTPVMED